MAKGLPGNISYRERAPASGRQDSAHSHLRPVLSCVLVWRIVRAWLGRAAHIDSWASGGINVAPMALPPLVKLQLICGMRPPVGPGCTCLLRCAVWACCTSTYVSTSSLGRTMTGP